MVLCSFKGCRGRLAVGEGSGEQQAEKLMAGIVGVLSPYPLGMLNSWPIVDTTTVKHKQPCMN